MKFFFIAVLVFVTAISCTPKVYTTPPQNFKNQLTVMSYNIHHCNPPSKPGVIDVDAIARVIKNEKPDIVALQEVDINTSRSGKINQAALLSQKTGLRSFYFAKAIDFDGGQYGIAILSKYPLSNTTFYKLPNDAANKGEPRVLAIATVTLPGNRKIRFAGTHLEAYDKHTRQLQMDDINNVIADEQLPLLIAGDFNANERSAVIKTLDQQFTRTCSSCAFTIPVEKPETAIDFIAYRKPAHFNVVLHKVVNEPYASDHLPVVAVLKLN